MSAGASLNTPTPSTTALPSVFEILTIIGTGTLLTKELLANNLSCLNVWFMQTGVAPFGALTVTVQFADGVAVGGGPDWMPLVSPFGLVPLLSVLNNYKLGCRRYRASINVVAGQAVLTTVRYHMTASI